MSPSELIRRLVVGDLKSDRVEYFEADSRFQMVFCIGQGFEFVVGREPVFIEVNLALFALAVGANSGKKQGQW